MAMLLVLCTLLVGTVGQRCECYTDTRGNGQGVGNWITIGDPECDTCAPGFEGTYCNYEYQIWCEPGRCTDDSKHQCNELSQSCTCDDGFDGVNCQRCRDDSQWYPFCGFFDKCEARTTCNNRGDCLPDTIPCGVEGCTDTQKCYDDTRCIDIKESGCGDTTCDWNEFCADRTSGTCCDKGLEENVCFPEFNNGTARGDPVCCQSHETCCDGVCCSSDTTCEEKAPPSNLGWVTGDGDAYGYTEHFCNDQTLGFRSSIRVAIVPVILLLLTVIEIGRLVLSARAITSSTGPYWHLTICITFLVFLNIFPLFSSLWQRAALTLFVCWSLLMLIRLNMQGYFGWGFMAIVINLFMWCTSSAVLLVPWLFFYASTTVDAVFPPLYNWVDSGFSSTYPLVSMRSSPCSQYYGYFRAHPDSLAWDHNYQGLPSTEQYWGYCSTGWMATVDFFNILIMMTMIVLLVLVAQLQGGLSFGGKVDIVRRKDVLSQVKQHVSLP